MTRAGIIILALLAATAAHADDTFVCYSDWCRELFPDASSPPPTDAPGYTHFPEYDPCPDGGPCPAPPDRIVIDDNDKSSGYVQRASTSR